MAINDITGDQIRTKGTSNKYRDNWDKIFKGKVHKPDPEDNKITGLDVTTIIIDEFQEGNKDE